MAVSRETRLLVIAPHPDDETLAAGGLMQRVHTAHGVVRVVYLTDGDGYPEGVQAEDHVVAPTATDYRGYGRQRRHEARAAMSALKLRDYTLTFLNFPDGGLSALMTKYWSERAGAYRSPFTRLDRPPRAADARPGYGVPRRGSDAGARGGDQRIPPDDRSGASQGGSASGPLRLVVLRRRCVGRRTPRAAGTDRGSGQLRHSFRTAGRFRTTVRRCRRRPACSAARRAGSVSS